MVLFSEQATHLLPGGIGAASAIGAVLYGGLPPMELAGLAHAAGPPHLPVSAGADHNAAQAGIGLVIPLPLQVWGQAADVWAS